MKHSKLITSLALAVLFAFSTTVFAADSDKKKGKGNNPIAKLDLTKEQKKALGEYNKSAAAKRKEVAAITDKKAKRAKQTEMAKAYQAKLKEVLTEEQFAKYEKLQAEARKAKGDKKKKKDNE